MAHDSALTDSGTAPFSSMVQWMTTVPDSAEAVARKRQRVTAAAGHRGL